MALEPPAGSKKYHCFADLVREQESKAKTYLTWGKEAAVVSRVDELGHMTTCVVEWYVRGLISQRPVVGVCFQPGNPLYKYQPLN